jgi:alanyl aminopeptidase
MPPAMRSTATLTLISMFLSLGCGAPAPEPERPIETTGRETVVVEEEAELPPEGPLPAGVTPLRYTLALTIDPRQERFSGVLDIRARFAAPVDRFWMHGALLNVTAIHVAPGPIDASGATAVPTEWHAAEREGLAEVVLASPVGPGEATIHIEYDAPFDRQLKGIYRVDVGDDHYAFTQFESTSARYAFPSFDEPRFKTPFAMSITAPSSDRVIGNTLETSAEDAGEGLTRHVFAETLPLPTYLIALAVGPLEVIEAPPIPANAVRTRPLPFRGIAARGRGAELRYAMEHTPAIVASLESYFGIEYPYDKLDILAVPDFASGAMENAGAITFREQLLLLSATPAEEQIRAFTNVMAHELAHQWFGNLVTMPWWDDIWLNEAFATWMAARVVRDVAPDQHAELSALSSVHGAMFSDSLAAARRIRQPIESDHDIRNAFDGITYQKGMGVLAMFEAWLGEETFRDGIRHYLNAHRLGTATSEDLMASLSTVSHRDVATPFFTFLTQPGVPVLRASIACGEGGRAIDLVQSRYLPLGSTAEASDGWQIPVCIRYGDGRTTHEACTLMTGTSARIAVEGDTCPTWVMPNANAAGYYRFALGSTELRALLETGWARLSTVERLSVANNVRSAFSSGASTVEDVVFAMDRIAADDERLVRMEPASFYDMLIEDYLEGEARAPLRAHVASLYAPAWRRIGWSARRREAGENAVLRRDLLAVMTRIARDPTVRREAADRGRRYLGMGGDGAIHADAVAPDLVSSALWSALSPEEGRADAAAFDAMLTAFRGSSDAVLRQRLLYALGSVEDPALAERALALNVDPDLRVNEVLLPIFAQVGTTEGRVRAFDYTTSHFDAIFARVATTRGGYAPLAFQGFCDEAHRVALEAFFSERIGALPGGPRNLAAAMETISLCTARRARHLESVRTYAAGLASD